ncbi:MAG: ATP-binding protein [Phycisphaerae bacterium]|nr:ATP-binding protein [Phycisphaerae bacterium]
MGAETPRTNNDPAGDDGTFMSESAPMNRTLRMEIQSDPAELKSVRVEVESFARALGMTEHAAGKVVLAMDEALTNIIRHAYDGAADRPIEIDLAVRDACLHVTLRDYGRQAPRATIHSRDLSDVRPGGLGVHIMTKCMDSVDYQPAPDGGTTLIMTKSLRDSDNERTNGPCHD